MGLPSADFETDNQQIAAFITNRAPELSPSPLAFAGEEAGALAQLTQSLGGNIDRVGKDIVPSTESSETGLNNWAITEGISNGTGPGGYGRRGATFAQGASGTLTGEPLTTTYTAGQQATQGGVTLRLRNNVTLPGSGQADGIWDADPSSPQSIGLAGNLPAGTVLTLISPPSGSTSTMILASNMAILGRDVESDSSLLTRILNKMQRPPNGGNGTDYRTWAQDATDANGNPVSSAQIFAYVYPNYYGVGSPLVVVLVAGTGTGRQASASLLAAIALFINGSTSAEGQRPVSHDCTVLTGYMPASRALVCRVRTVVALDASRFDWARGTVSYTVNSITTSGLPSWATNAGANVVLELAQTAPISLKDAIGASAGSGTGPHIQVDTKSGANLLGPVVPEQWPCLAFLDAAGRTSLGLKVSSVPNFAAQVNAGNDVYSGGPVVAPVAANILATIDNIASSRVSGLADPAQQWQDTVGVTTLSTAAETTVGDDGITRLVSRCVAGGVLIGVGGGATPTAQDVTASDNTINGPEVLYAGRILVTD